MRDTRDRLVGAATRILRPLVRRLLSLGVPFGQLELSLRQLFVEVAEKDLAAPGQRQTDSRIALVTGINRKEVKRIRSNEGAGDAPRVFSMNHVTNLISRWMTDPKTTDRRGRPRALPYQAARGPSFMKLARAVTGDLAPGVLLEELVRSGAVVKKGEMVMLRTDAYVPKLEESEKLQILEEDPPELINTILTNVFAESDVPLLQRKVYFDNLGKDASARIRAEMRQEGERFVRRVNRLLSRYDRDRNQRAPDGDKYYAGVGVYFFEAPGTSEKDAKQQSPPQVGTEEKKD